MVKWSNNIISLPIVEHRIKTKIKKVYCYKIFSMVNFTRISSLYPGAIKLIEGK